MMRFSYKLKDSPGLCKNIKSFFDEVGIEDLARSTGFVKRRRLLTGYNFLNLCVFGVFKEGLSASLIQLCGFLFKSDILISSESLNQRFNSSAVLFMKSLFEKALTNFLNKKSNLNLLNAFNGVNIQDSTSFQLPNCFSNKYTGCGGVSSEAGLKIDLTFNIQNGSSEISIRSGGTNDHGQTNTDIKGGSLWLRDLGYLKLTVLKYINSCYAYYISRLKTTILIYDGPQKEANLIELETFIQTMEENEIIEMEVYIGKNERLPVRLIVQKVPNDIAEQRRYKIKKDKKSKAKKLSARRLSLCALSLMITNIPISMLNARDIFKVYQIRWQIELIFKIWKSHFQIHTVKKMKIQRMECQLYGRLILILLNTMIMTSMKIQLWNKYGIDISEFKAMQLLRDSSHIKWIKTINKTTKDLKKALQNTILLFSKHGQKSYKKGKFSPLKLSLT